MKKTLLLIKAAINAALSNTQVSESPKKKYLYIGLYIFLSLYMGATSFSMSIMMFEQMAVLPNSEAIMGFSSVIMLFVTSVLIFSTSLFSASNMLFKAKDLEMQLAMPLTHFNIVLAKFMGVYFMNLLFSLVIMLPNCVLYFIYTEFNAGVFVMFLLSILLIPLIPCIFGSALSALITYGLRKFRYKNFLTLIFSFAFFFLYFKFFGNIEGYINYIANSADELFSNITSFYLPALLFLKTLSGDFLYFLLYITLSVLPVLLLLWALTPFYSKLVAAANQTFVKSDFKFKVQKAGSRTTAMLKKEISMFFSSAIYVMNTVFMLVLLTGFSVYVIISKDKFLTSLEMFPELGDLSSLIFPFALAALMATAAMSATTASSISLEGKKLWIYKSSPVTTAEIFNAKILVTMVVAVPLIVINAVMYTFAFSFDVVQLLLLIFVPSVAIYVAAQLGLIFNLLFPKLEWKNEAMVVKNSTSAILSLLTAMLIAVLLIYVGYNILVVSTVTIAAASVLAILCVFLFAFYMILKTFGTKKFDNLTANS